MSSAFASQLKAIAATSSHELDLRARRNAHAESLLFEPAVAAKQDFDTIFAICIQGFQELCYLDPQFRVFERNLFSTQAKDQDRDLMTKTENEALDAALEQCLCLLGSKLLLKPAIKALEWLVRRFRINVHNVSCLLQTLLPYHEHSLWATAISIIPNEKFVGVWKFIRPYLNNTWTVPRHVVAYTMVNSDAFFTLTNSYTLHLCRAGFEYSSQMRFWGSLVVEAITTRLSQARSGRKEILSQRMEDLLLKVIGFLNDAYAIHTSQDLLTTCHTIVMVLAAKADLAENVLDSLAKSVADTMSNLDNDNRSSLIAIAIICASRNDPQVPNSLLKLSINSPFWNQTMRSISTACPIQALLLGYVNTAVAKLQRAHDQNVVFFLQSLFKEASSWDQVTDFPRLLIPILTASLNPTPTESDVESTRQAFKEILQQVADDDQNSKSLLEAAQSLGIDTSTLEELLLKTLSAATDVAMITDGNPDVMAPVIDASETFETLVQQYSNHFLDSPSFLVHPQYDCYPDLLKIYDMSLRSPDRWKSFLSMPLWASNRSTGGDLGILLATFLLTVACDRKSSVLRRVFALQALNDKSNTLVNDSLQTIFPYTLMLLSDREPSVRRASAGLLRALSERCHTDASKATSPYLASEIYPGSSSSEELIRASSETISKFFDQGLSPNLEECLLDASNAEELLRGLFDGSQSSELKKATRNNFFEALRFHAIYSPFLVYKLWLIRITAGVTKVGASHKNKLLLPMLEHWVQIPDEQAVSMAEENDMYLSQADLAIVAFIDTWDKDTVSTVLGSTLILEERKRLSLVEAVYQQLLATWNACKDDVRLLHSRALWAQACSGQPHLSTNAQVVLRDVSLPLEAQHEILQHALEAFDKIPQPASPSRKRKRSSAAHDGPRPRLGQEIDDMVSKLTLALEVARASEVEDKPELLGLLFDSMSALKQLKQIHRFDLPYLVQSTLTSIQAVLQYIQANKIQIDLSILKTELITDCLRSNEQPQVQEKALLVSAALANLAPERLIHSIMPVFTFMDKNIFARDDDHSVNVVNQAIDEIIPVLTCSLQKKKQPHAFLSAMASTISSLVSAIDHVPAHRRVAFYQRLLSQVGAGELGHLLLALLSQNKRNDPKFASFLTSVVSNTDAQTTLQIYCNLIDLASAIMDTSSTTANAVFGFDQKTKVDERYSSLRPVLLASLAVLKSETLQRSTRRLRKLDDSASEAIKAVLDRAFRETLKTAEASKAYNVKTRALAAECLEHLLQLPALSELFVLLPASLEAMDEPLRAVTLRVVALQIGQSSDLKIRAREMALSFLGNLQQEISNPAASSSLLTSALKCMDQIVGKYGRKDLEAVSAAFTALMDVDLDNQKPQSNVQTTILLTMANMMEILGETAVPLVPQLVLKALTWLKNHTGSNHKPSAASANALFAVFSAVFSYAPYMVSDEQLNDLLPMLLELETDGAVEVADGVRDLLSIIARRVDLDVLLRTVTMTSKSLDTNSGRLDTVANLLSDTINSASRAAISKNAEDISIAFLQLLQHEAGASHSGKQESRLMSKLKDLCIKFIYKLNDTSFRPLFESWVEWGFGASDSTSTLTKSRQIALAHILTYFFDTLKSLVTSYMAYLLKPICGILTDTTTLFLGGNSKSVKIQPKTSIDNLDLVRFEALLTVLRTSLEHDAPSVSTSDTSLFATPSNFPILADALIATLNLQFLKSVRHSGLLQRDIFTTLTALATATSATPTTHQTLAQQLIALRRHSSAHVRLASILAFKALTSDEECGEEFIANTIGISNGEDEGARGSVFGELMVYVNEMLEDDDEDVEREVRMWVQDVRSRVGEDVFES